MFKHLVKDTVVYGVANAVQKLVPFFVVPLVVHQLGQEALKIYDVSFVYAYLFSWLLISTIWKIWRVSLLITFLLDFLLFNVPFFGCIYRRNVVR